MVKQLIAKESFTSVQEAQAGITRLFEKAAKEKKFYRVMRNQQPLGVLIPNEVWEDFIEDMEAASSENFKKEIAKSQASKKRYSSEEIKREFGLL